MAMSPEIKGKWVQALRSGDYRQGKGRLRVGETYCCLGVLCELAVQDGVVSRNLCQPLGDVYLYYYTGKGSLPIQRESLLPFEVQEWARLDTINPRVRLEWGTDLTPLASINDAGFTFEVIADLIEKQL